MITFYVYAYLRQDGTPYYIGKGQGYRAFDKHNVKVPKDRRRIVFLETNLSEVGALALERRYIKWYGRKDNHTGILRNLTDGGDGVCGMVHTEQSRQLMSKQRLGKSFTVGHRQALSDGWTLERKQTVSQRFRGCARSPESIEKQKQSYDADRRAKISERSKNKSPQHKQALARSIKERCSKPITVDGMKYDSIKAASTALGICENTIRNWYKKGERVEYI